MRLRTWVMLLFIVVGGLLIINCVWAEERDKGYLIVTDQFCIVVRTPDKQLFRDIGQDPLGIILKDKTTQIIVRGNYLAIAVPVAKLKDTITRYHLQKLIIIE